MTLSPRPWHLNPSSTEAFTLHDKTGKQIGTFKRWEDGEHLLALEEKVKELEAEVERLEGDIKNQDM